MINTSANIIGYYNFNASVEEINKFNEIKSTNEKIKKNLSENLINFILNEDSILKELKQKSKIPNVVFNNLIKRLLEIKDDLINKKYNEEITFYKDDEYNNQVTHWFYNIFMNELKIYKSCKLNYLNKNKNEFDKIIKKTGFINSKLLNLISETLIYK